MSSRPVPIIDYEPYAEHIFNQCKDHTIPLSDRDNKMLTQTLHSMKVIEGNCSACKCHVGIEAIDGCIICLREDGSGIPLTSPRHCI